MQIDSELKQELKQFILDRQKKNLQKVVIRVPYFFSMTEMETLYGLFSFLREGNVQQVVDNSILAGVVIEFGSKRIDLSLISELHKLQQLVYDIA